MSGPAKVIVVDADPAANAALRFGLARAGISAAAVAEPAELGQAARTAALVLVGEDADGAGVVGAVRKRLDDASLPTPILFVGDGVERTEVERAGAAEVVMGPAFLRDIASAARVMLCERRAEGWGGTLAEFTGVLGLVRALAALGRSGVLTLTRGIRRGEIRYYHGEITSAQVGIIHGQAAFHQLLLWTEARFDFRQELVVRRQQIPLPPEEVMADAERFLESMRDIAGGLSPSAVLDVIPERIGALAIKIPTEVHGILNMFDGRRNLVDILEDSPYRVHETLRVARKGFESKVLRVVPQTRNRRSWRAALPIEDWLIGGESPPPGLLGGATEGEDAARRHKRDSGPLDWSELVPRTSNLDMPTLSPIVPATKVAGEIHVEGDAQVRAAPATRTVIVSEDAILTPEDRAEEARLVRERAEREAAAEVAAKAAAEQAAKEAAAQEAAAKEAAAKAAAAAEQAAKEAAAQAAAAKAAAEQAAKEAAAKEAAAKEAASAAAEAIASAETLPVSRPGAARRPTTSDILPKNKKRKRSKTSQPVGVEDEPSVLVADLQAAHDAVSELAEAQAAAAASPDVGPAGAALSAVAQRVTQDASQAVASFTADEEAFFQAGHHQSVDSFADLDVGHRRPTFWQRLFGRARSHD